jgi:uncharacterized membrane protein
MSRWLLFAAALTAAALAASLVVWYGFPDRLPDPLPTHWNVRGEPDAWVARDRALPYLLLPPAVMAGLLLLTFVLPWLSPKQFDVDRFRPTYHFIMALLVALMGYVHAAILAGYLWPGLDTVRLLVAGLLLFFAVLGNVMGKVRRNFWIGVRTPWTLASEAVWIGTHRHAAWLWTAFGLIGAVAVLLGAPLIACFVGLMAVALWPVLYSLWLYKRLERAGKIPDPSAEPVARS